MKFFTPSSDPQEGLGVLLLFRLIEESVPAFFHADRPIRIVRAPGRLDVFGGRAAGPGALVLQLPIAEGACAAIQARDDDLVRLWSPCRDGSRTQLLSMQLQDLGLPQQPIDYEEARALFGGDPRDRWAGYLLGALVVLARECGLRPSRGVEFLLHSDIPEGRGVSASAAITVAALRAFAVHYEVELGADRLAALAALVEAEVQRTPARIVDGRTVVSAKAGELLAQRDGVVEASVVVPMDLEFVGLESGAPTVAAHGADDHDDDAAAERFRELLAREPAQDLRHQLGDVLFAAHAAYGVHGRNDVATDLIVATAKRRRDAGGGIFGAKATGRGGGTVVLLGERGKVWYEALRIKKALLQATGHSGHVFRWSSPGALAFGSIELQPNSRPPGGIA